MLLTAAHSTSAVVVLAAPPLSPMQEADGPEAGSIANQGAPLLGMLPLLPGTYNPEEDHYLPPGCYNKNTNNAVPMLDMDHGQVALVGTLFARRIPTS
jgi:hypothetical protein